MAKHSELQRQVLKLYKRLLRSAKDKPGVASQVQYYFRKNATLAKTDTFLIEQLLRRGWRTLQMLEDGSVTGMGSWFTALINFIWPDKALEDIGILYVSPNFIIVNKHCDVLINSNRTNGNEITVEKQLRYFFPHLVDENVKHGFRFTHRLDFSTSGVLCLALNKEAAKSASVSFEMRLTAKYYLALVHGHVSTTTLSIDKGIGIDSRPNFSHCMCTESNSYCSKAKRALTLIVVLELGLYNGKPASKIMLKPITGRRHQLRVHCHEVNHTIIGDYTYSQRRDVSPYRMFLHAFRLVLPASVENIDIHSADPFTDCDDRNLWTPIKIINSIDETIYSKFPDIKL